MRKKQICMLSNIYQAGRLQGIREQKAKCVAKGIEHPQANGTPPFAVRMEGGSMRANTPFTGNAPTDADKAAVDKIMLSLFFAWLDEIAAPGAKRDMEQLKPFMEITGAGASSGLCIMYEAFINGVNAGLELAQSIDRTTGEKPRF